MERNTRLHHPDCHTVRDAERIIGKVDELAPRPNRPMRYNKKGDVMSSGGRSLSQLERRCVDESATLVSRT